MPAGRQVRDPILQPCRLELCKRGQIRSPAGWPHLGLRRNSAVQAPAVPALLPVQRSSRRGLPNASKAPTMLMRKNSARPAFSIRSSSPAGGAHRRGDRPVAPAGALVRELVEAERRLAVRRWVAREADVAEVKVDVAGFGQLEGRANGVFMASEELRHLQWALQRPLRIGRQATADILERGSMADGRQDVVEQLAAAMVVADVVGGDGSRSVAFGERSPRLQYPDVVRPEVVMQRDEDVLSAESLLQRAQPRLVVGRGQEEQVPGVLLHRLQRGAGLALELALVGQADETAEVRVAAAGAGK